MFSIVLVVLSLAATATAFAPFNAGRVMSKSNTLLMGSLPDTFKFKKIMNRFTFRVPLYLCVVVKHIFVLSIALWDFPMNFQGFLARWNSLVRRMPTSSWAQKHHHHHYCIVLFFTYSPYLFKNTLPYNHAPSLRRPLLRPSRSQDSLRPYQAAHSPSSPLLTMPSSNTSMPQKPPRRHSW